jgi:hypothetical protein
MSEFSFSLNGASVGSLVNRVPQAQASFESQLASGAKNSDLVYTGDDYLIWDRTNGERLRRGLPGLAEIGYPRPKDSPPSAENSSAYYGPPPNINIPEVSGEVFKIKGPPGMTFDQAKAIFETQVKTGSLTGFKVGDTLSAATQAADGLEAARSELSQVTAGFGGALPAGTNLNSLTASLGPLGAAAAGQVSSAITGSTAGLASLATGALSLPGSVGSALSGVTRTFSGLTPSLSAASASLTSTFNTAASTGGTSAVLGALTGAAAQIGSVASQSIGTIAKSMTGTPAAGINVADFVKQGPSLGSIGNMTSADVTGALAQANKLVGQSAKDISNTLGVGKFGFNVTQLEKVGVVKPGTAASWLASGENDLTDVLQSPTVWTGKEGIKNIGSLLGNGPLQDKFQQDLMKAGLSDLKTQGIPTDTLTAQAQAGVSTMSARSVTATVDWAKNNGLIPPELKASFDNIAANSAFAVNLTKTRVDAPVKQEVAPQPVEASVNSQTVDAAATRVVGDSKVPEVLAGSSSAGKFIAIYQWKDFVGQIVTAFKALNAELHGLNSELITAITQEEYDRLNGQAQVLRAAIRQRGQELFNAATQEANTISRTNPTIDERIALKELEYANFLENKELLRESDTARNLLREILYKLQRTSR